MPESMFIRVVLPLPFSPSKDKISPSCSSRLIDLFATTCPKRLVMFLSSIAFAKQVILSVLELLRMLVRQPRRRPGDCAESLSFQRGTELKKQGISVKNYSYSIIL